MSTNKNASIRYNALDKCFRNPGKQFFLEDLIESCNQALYEFNGSTDGIKKRQLYDDIRYMKSEQGWNIELEKKLVGKKPYYRYKDTNFSINKQPLNDQEVEQFKEALLTLKRFKGMPQFEWVEEIITRFESSYGNISAGNIIAFEQNIYLEGLNFLEDLYHYISQKQKVRIAYKSFKSDTIQYFELSPYFLKQYNSRWFLFGGHDDYDSLTNLALDRIKNIELLSGTYKNTEIDFENYFEDIIGVSIPEDKELYKIILKVDSNQLPYILSKPIHGSQKHLQHPKYGEVIQLELMVNFELKAVLRSFGNSIQILEPKGMKI